MLELFLVGGVVLENDFPDKKYFVKNLVVLFFGVKKSILNP